LWWAETWNWAAQLLDSDDRGHYAPSRLQPHPTAQHQYIIKERWWAETLGTLVLAAAAVARCQFGVLVVFMVTYNLSAPCTWLRWFLTAYLLILFQLLGLQATWASAESSSTAALGCAIAFAAGYFLFPRWGTAHRLLWPPPCSNLVDARAS
jgi:hypothetical protein